MNVYPAYTIHPEDEIAGVPWDKLTPEAFGRTWNLDRNSHGEPWSIYVSNTDLGIDYIHEVWRLPGPLGTAIERLVRHARDNGYRAAKAEIKKVLEI